LNLEVFKSVGAISMRSPDQYALVSRMDIAQASLGTSKNQGTVMIATHKEKLCASAARKVFRFLEVPG
jgi:hypothetical protein